MRKNAPPRRKRPNPWIVASLVLLVLALAWRYWAGLGEVAPRQRHVKTSMARTPVYRQAETRPQPLPMPPEVHDLAGQIETPSDPEVEEPPISTEQPIVEQPPAVETGPPDEPQTILPPCPKPLAPLRAAWSRRDWTAIHEILGGIVNREDCSAGAWDNITWAFHEVEALIQKKQQYVRNPFLAIRSMHLAILKVLDQPESLLELTIVVTGVSEGQIAGFKRVEGTDSTTGNQVVVLTRQTASLGVELSFWAVEEPESPEPGLLRDMSLYAPLVDRNIFKRMRNDEGARARLRSDVRQEFEKIGNADSMALQRLGQEKRDSLRQESLAVLAKLDSRDSTSDEANIQQAIEAMQAKEDDLHKRMGKTLNFLGEQEPTP